MVVSELAKVGVRKNDYKGLVMYDLTPEIKPQVKCTMALNHSQKLLQKGTLSIDRHENSHSFDNEVVISVWGHEQPVQEQRAQNDGYYRTEIPVPVTVAIKLLEKALQKLWLL